MKKDLENINTSGEIIIYKGADGSPSIDVRVEGETVWLSQAQIADLFGVQRPAITKHIGNIFKEGELDEKVVSSILEHTTVHGAIKGKTQTKSVKLYNLEMILALGYRVNSVTATRFRQWATERLREYLVAGFTMNDEFLKNNGKLIRNIFKEGKLDEKVVCRNFLRTT